MAFPIRVCVICSEEFELRPDKPGYANRCPSCSTEEAQEQDAPRHLKADEAKVQHDLDASRRRAIRDLLYSKDS